MSPVIVPPARGSAALAVVVVEVNTPSRAAISTPSTVPVTSILPDSQRLRHLPPEEPRSFAPDGSKCV